MIVRPVPGRRRPTTPQYAHLPANLDLKAVTRPAWADYAAWVVSTVLFRRFLDRTADETTFVPLDSRYVNLHIPAKVRKPLLADLRANGVLDCDDLYYFQPGAPGQPGKCLCYRLGPSYRGQTVRPHPLTHSELIRKMATAYQQEREAVSDPTHLALRGWHDQVEILPDAPDGVHLLLTAIKDGVRRFTVCPQGRVHTNVANLPAQYRQYLRLAGRELVSVDICTSQPLLLGLTLTGSTANTTFPRQIRGGHNTEAIYVPSSDTSLNEYLRDCLKGEVYDRIATETDYSRDEVKPLFLAVIYGEPQHMHTVVGEAIRKLYPAVFDAVVELNFELGQGGLPRLMQTVESRVMIGRVAGRLVREYPDMPLLTVHDSIVVPPEFFGVVENVIAEEWTAEFGLAPRTKTSSFTSPQPPRKQRKKRRRAWNRSMSQQSVHASIESAEQFLAA